MAATQAITNLFQTGDHVILNDDGYGGTQRFFRRISAQKHNLSISLVSATITLFSPNNYTHYVQVDLTNESALRASLKPETKLVWFETPTNPLLKITDIAEVVQIVREFNKDIVVVVDNTFMTPYFQVIKHSYYFQLLTFGLLLASFGTRSRHCDALTH